MAKTLQTWYTVCYKGKILFEGTLQTFQLCYFGNANHNMIRKWCRGKGYDLDWKEVFLAEINNP